MLTYELQARRFFVDDKSPLVFPNACEVTLEFSPAATFGGGGDDQIRTAKVGAEASLHWNANTGSSWVESENPIEPVSVIVAGRGEVLELTGNKLVLSSWCETLEELQATVQSLYYLTPLVMNIDLADPPVVATTVVDVGGVGATWQVAQSQGQFDGVTTEIQEERLRRALDRLVLVARPEHRRIAAALHYFHRACRLDRVAKSPWEFAAERILNYAKVLQVLFGETRDEIRGGLAALGYSTDAIEGDFVPMMLLRNHFDVGHASIAIHDGPQLESIYRYLERAEGYYRDFLSQLVVALEEGRFELAEEEDLGLDPEQRRRMALIVESVNSREQRW